jgi:predicted transcriptional regulator of viral defense system
MTNTTRRYQNLYRIASEQGGFFTTKQAITCGYQTSSHPYHVKAGNWVREHRSIYRLVNFPTDDRPDLILWYLWSRNRNEEPQGIYSHETSLALRDLSDINPGKLHMTVPKGFRRNSPIPEVIVLHYSDVPTSDIEQMYGVKITNTMRTLMDLIMEGTLSDEILYQAISEAIDTGMISKRALQEAREKNQKFNDFLDRMKL